MGRAKDIVVKPISAKDARRLVRKIHYSGKVVNNSSLHLGVFLDDACEGVMQFGSPFIKENVINLVKGTAWTGMLELNRMAFSDKLPKNSESRALGIAFRLIKKNYTHIKWILSFSDGTQCGDGTIYRASGFVLTQISKNNSIIQLDNGDIVASMTYTKGSAILKQKGRAGIPDGAKKLPGFQLRYIYFIDKSYKDKLTVPILPFSEIDKMGAGMYKGIRRGKKTNSSDQLESGGALPTTTLQSEI